MTIVLGKGLDDILFFVNEASVREKMGAPDKTVTLREDGHEWLYYKLMITLFFDGCSHELTSIEVENPEAKMLGEKVIHMRRDLFMNLLMDNNICTQEVVDDNTLFFEEQAMTVEFEYDKVSRICFSPKEDVR